MDGKRVKEIREMLGMTQQEFAEHVGVALSSVANWENGRSAPSRMAIRSIEGMSVVGRPVVDDE